MVQTKRGHWRYSISGSSTSQWNMSMCEDKLILGYGHTPTCLIVGLLYLCPKRWWLFSGIGCQLIINTLNFITKIIMSNIKVLICPFKKNDYFPNFVKKLINSLAVRNISWALGNLGFTSTYTSCQLSRWGQKSPLYSVVTKIMW